MTTATPTGTPVTQCPDCGRTHPATRPHCPVCGLATIWGHNDCTPDDRAPLPGQETLL